MKNFHHNTVVAIPKHPGTFPYSKGNEVPAYNTDRRTYKRTLEPMRDKRALRLDVLCDVIKEISPENACSCLTGGIIVNTETIMVQDGLAVVNSGLKFRFCDVSIFLSELKHEKILYCQPDDLKTIKHRYFEILNELYHE